MPGSLRDGQELAWTQSDFAIHELDHQLTVDAEEGLVGIRMAVPWEGFGHDAQADLMIVDGFNPLVVIGLMDAPADPERIDRRRCSMCSVAHGGMIVQGVPRGQ